jgi:hypothetical protein
MYHINFLSMLDSVLNWQFSIDPSMNVQYTGDSTKQFATYSSEDFSIQKNMWQIVLWNLIVEKLWIVMRASTGENPQVGRLGPHHL